MVISPSNLLLASTHCVEVVITDSSIKGDEPAPGPKEGKGSKFTGQIVFNQYLSSAKVQEPTDSRTFHGVEAWTSVTPFFLDGHNLKPEYGYRLLTKDRQVFMYNSRSKAVFRFLSVTPFPKIGELVKHEGDSLVTRRLITHKFDSAGIVYVDQAHKLAADAKYLLDGKDSTAADAIAAGRMIRLFEAQPLKLSAYSAEASVDANAARAAGEKRIHPHGHLEANSDAGVFHPTGGETITFDMLARKTYLLIDGQFQFNKRGVVNNCGQATVHNLSTKKPGSGEFLIGRSHAKGIDDGTVVEVTADAVKIKLTQGGAEESIAIADVKEFLVDGIVQDGAAAFKPGMSISIVRQLPQRVDVWSVAPYPNFDEGKTAKTFGDMERSYYDVDGNRHIIKEGRAPSRLKK